MRGMHQNLGLNLSMFRPLIFPAIKFSPRGNWLGKIPWRYITSYQHTLSAFPGFDNCSFNLLGNVNFIESWVSSGLGRHIDVIDQTLVTIFEGFVNEWAANQGSLQVSGGPLMDVINRETVTYTQIDPTADPPATGIQTETPITDDTDSQEKYGIIEEVISGGRAISTEALYLRDAILEDKKDAQISENLSIGSGGQSTSISVKCLGYWAYLGQYVYNSANTLTSTAGAKIIDVLSNDPNAIFNRSSYPYIDDPAILVAAAERDNSMALDVIKAIVARGGGPPDYERWLFGIYENVTPHYKAIPQDVAYQHRIMGPGQYIEKFGTSDTIYPWQVKAGEWLYLPDFLAGRASTFSITDRRKDPRYLFIESVTYTAPWTLQITGRRQGKLEQIMADYGLGGMA